MNKLSGFKFVVTFVLKFKETINGDETKYSTFYSNLKAETIIRDADVDSILESIYSIISAKARKYQAESSGWTIDSVIEQNIDVSKYKPLSGSNCIKLPKEF